MEAIAVVLLLTLPHVAGQFLPSNSPPPVEDFPAAYAGPRPYDPDAPYEYPLVVTAYFTHPEERYARFDEVVNHELSNGIPELRYELLRLQFLEIDGLLENATQLISNAWDVLNRTLEDVDRNVTEARRHVAQQGQRVVERGRQALVEALNESAVRGVTMLGTSPGKERGYFQIEDAEAGRFLLDSPYLGEVYPASEFEKPVAHPLLRYAGKSADLAGNRALLGTGATAELVVLDTGLRTGHNSVDIASSYDAQGPTTWATSDDASQHCHGIHMAGASGSSHSKRYGSAYPLRVHDVNAARSSGDAKCRGGSAEFLYALYEDAFSYMVREPWMGTPGVPGLGASVPHRTGSWGRGSLTGAGLYAGVDTLPNMMEWYATTHGILGYHAAGNTDREGCQTPDKTVCPGYADTYCAVHAILCVGAFEDYDTDSWEDDQPAWYSQRNLPSMYAQRKPDLMGPSSAGLYQPKGTAVKTTGGGGGKDWDVIIGGTSFSSAFTAGIGARLHAYGGYADPFITKALLIESAHHPTSTLLTNGEAWTEDWGWGRVQAAAAARALSLTSYGANTVQDGLWFAFTKPGGGPVPANTQVTATITWNTVPDPAACCMHRYPEPRILLSGSCIEDDGTLHPMSVTGGGNVWHAFLVTPERSWCTFYVDAENNDTDGLPVTVYYATGEFAEIATESACAQLQAHRVGLGTLDAGDPFFFCGGASAEPDVDPIEDAVNAWDTLVYYVGEADPAARDFLEASVRDVCALVNEVDMADCVRALQTLAVNGAGGAAGLALAVAFLLVALLLGAVGLVEETAEPLLQLALELVNLVFVVVCGSPPQGLDVNRCWQPWVDLIMANVELVVATAWDTLFQALWLLAGTVCPGQAEVTVTCLKQRLDELTPSCLQEDLEAGEIPCPELWPLDCASMAECVQRFEELLGPTLECVKQDVKTCVMV